MWTFLCKKVDFMPWFLMIFKKKSLLCKKVDFMYVSSTSYLLLLFPGTGYREGGSATSLRESRLIHMYLLPLQILVLINIT